ncbi:putative conserved with possible signal peptide [Cryptosporidium bovis]|uniref:putative conserved with possible signal peptide n=1 Tax=Cryptosporidium bovis TaxID=310047 RepID=UPI00351A02B2|nr:putative conserved with possible signal peptide [Cryptosporidium bovis]
MTKARNKHVKKLSTNQNIKILIIWTIFIGILILFLQLIYKYVIKRIIVYVLSLFGYKTNTRSDNCNGNNGVINNKITDENGRECDLNDNKFMLSIGICYKSDIDSILKNKFMDSLLKLSKLTDLYLFVQVDNDDDEKHIMEILENNGIFDSGLKKHKVLFCEKLETIPSFARQLQANMHIDTSDENILKLKDKVPNAVSININNDDSINECVDNIEAILCSKQ